MFIPGDIKYPVNWEFIGMVMFEDEDLPEFIMIDGVKYEKKTKVDPRNLTKP
jgi:hypothetical protein